MFHYTLAHQLDHSSNRKLIDENLSKLRFRIQRLTIHSEDKLALYEYSSSSSDHYLNRHCKARFLRPAAGFGIYPNLNPANNNNVNQSSGQRWSSATTMETSKISSTSFFTSLDHHYHSNVLSISPPILSSYWKCSSLFQNSYSNWEIKMPSFFPKLTQPILILKKSIFYWLIFSIKLQKK